MDNTTRSACEIRSAAECPPQDSDTELANKEQDAPVECMQTDKPEHVAEPYLASLDANENASETCSAEDDTTESNADAPHQRNHGDGEVVVNSSNASLNNLLVYGSDDDSNSYPVPLDQLLLELDTGNSNSDPVPLDQLLLELDTGNSSEDDTDDDDDDEDDGEMEAMGETRKEHKFNPLEGALKQIGELTIDDLPPVEHADVSVKPEQCDVIGRITSILGKLVLVESLPNKPAYDINSIFFLHNGRKALGAIHDVIGPVTQPWYVIRYNTEEEIKERNISIDMEVFSAPETEHSNFVFVPQLLKEKGSDASGKNDVEIPPELQEFSDDEAESGLGELPANRKRSSLERHKRFEENMNMRNLLDSRLRDGSQQEARGQRRQGKRGRGRAGYGRHSRGGGRSHLGAGHPGVHHYRQAQSYPPPPPHRGFNAATGAAAAAASPNSAYPTYQYRTPMPFTNSTLSPYAPAFVPSVPPPNIPTMTAATQVPYSAPPQMMPPMMMPLPRPLNAKHGVPNLLCPAVPMPPGAVPNNGYFNHPPTVWGPFNQPPLPPVSTAMQASVSSEMIPQKNAFGTRRN